MDQGIDAKAMNAGKKVLVKSSEKLSPDLIRLFDEAEVDNEAVPTQDEDDEIIVPAHKRRKRGRNKLPEACPE
jgi:transposase